MFAHIPCAAKCIIRKVAAQRDTTRVLSEHVQTSHVVSLQAILAGPPANLAAAKNDNATLSLGDSRRLCKQIKHAVRR
jgi:hypothetical protein